MAVKIFSKLDYTVFVSYKDTSIAIPPFSRGLLIQDEKMLGELPKGVQKIKVKEGK